MTLPDPEQDSAIEENTLFEPEHPFNDESVFQSIVRTADETHEHLAAYFKVAFKSGQKTNVVHLNFWPLFQDRPEIVTRLLGSLAGNCRITQQEKFGARIEVSLSHRPEQDIDVVMELLATAPVSRQDKPKRSKTDAA